MRPRVYAVINVPPEISAYATVRYSRSPDSMKDSIAWIYRKSAEAAASGAEKFLDTYYFNYGHKSIADCGHVIMAIERWSQLMAEEVEDEQLWDGQEQSTRYQDFSRPKFFKPRGWQEAELMELYVKTIHQLFTSYHRLSQQAFRYYCFKNPKPDEMKQGDYERALRARAFDVARYLLPMAVKTNVGQITSIRVLERQIQRLLASRYPEIRLLGETMARACKEPAYDVAKAQFKLEDVLPAVEAAPTLAKYLEPDTYLENTRKKLKQLVEKILRLPLPIHNYSRVELHPPGSHAGYCEEVVTTAIYWVTNYSYQQCLDLVSNMKEEDQALIWNALFAERGQHDELLRLFRGGYPLTFDTCVDIGADRDLKRHRRCIQIRQDLSADYGYEIPAVLTEPGLEDEHDLYVKAVEAAHQAYRQLAIVHPYDALYVLPLGTRRRRLYKMDPAEAVYISELRTGVGGHFSYRAAAYQMFEKLVEWCPEFKEFIAPRVTHPSVEAPLKR